MAEEIRKIIQIDPAAAQAALEVYMGADKGYFLGGYIAGFFADAIFLGIVFHQFIHWWQYSRTEDGWVVKTVVYYSMILSVGISVYLAVWIFHMFVYGFGSYLVFMEIGWMSWWFVADVVIRIPVQAFFAERAWRMAGRKMWYLVLMVFLYVAALCLAIATKIIIVDPKLGHLAVYLIIVWLTVEIASDVIVTGTIAYCLWKSRTGWSGTDKLIGRLLRLILETQFPPTVFAILFLIFFLTIQSSSATSFFTCSPKVYAICLLAVLNSRHALRKDLSAEQTYTGNSYVLRGMRGANTGINVTTETYTHVARDPFPDTRSSNRQPKLYDLDLEVVDQDGQVGSTDKDLDDLGTSELGYNSSVVRLTGEQDDREVRFKP